VRYFDDAQLIFFRDVYRTPVRDLRHREPRDSRERLLVIERRRQDATRFRQITQLLLVLLARRDVLRDADDTLYRAILIAHRRAARIYPADRAVGPDDPVIERIFAFRPPGERLLHQRAILRMDGRQPRRSTAVCRRERTAPYALISGTDVEHILQCRRRDPEDFLHALREVVEALGVLAQLSLRLARNQVVRFRHLPSNRV
jgi:hypothetical protein